jgi:hypothetical protein
VLLVSTYLHRDEPIIHHDLLREKVGTDRRLILIRELLAYVLVHQRRLADAMYTPKARLLTYSSYRTRIQII